MCLKVQYSNPQKDRKVKFHESSDKLPIYLFGGYPLVNVCITMEKSHVFNGKIHYKWPFSIAFCMFTRVISTINHSYWSYKPT